MGSPLPIRLVVSLVSLFYLYKKWFHFPFASVPYGFLEMSIAPL